MGVKMNSLMPKKSEILQRFEIDKKTSFFSIKEMALVKNPLKPGFTSISRGSKSPGNPGRADHLGFAEVKG